MITRNTRTSRKEMAKMIDTLENNRGIKEVLFAISKGKKVTLEEKKRVINYEKAKRLGN